ncbi:MAG: hypothetical protein VW937_06340 [Actinomycetota bacterium]
MPWGGDGGIAADVAADIAADSAAGVPGRFTAGSGLLVTRSTVIA